MANADFIALSRTAVPLLLKANAELKEGRDSYKKLFGEYAECLQKLCMGVLYEACKPVSHKWPGKPHTETIVEGVNYLLSANMEKDKRIAELEGRVYLDK
jgi:hypothetical protein